MRIARPTSGLAVLTLSFGLGLAACNDHPALSRAAFIDDVGETDRIVPASQTITDGRSERPRVRRDRTRRRFGRTVDLLPHSGDYTIHETGFSTSRFKNAHGMLTIDLIDDCGDWTLQEKWDLDLRDQSDRPHRSNLLYRASEIRSSNKFVFAYSRDHMGERTDFIGDALEIDGGHMVRFQAPDIPDLMLPSDLSFPVTHLQQILSAARRQTTGFEGTIFDGGNDFAYRAVTTISQPLRADESSPRVLAARTALDQRTSDRLPDGRHWPVRVEYSPLDDPYAPAVFIREFLLHESGIVLSFHFDYGDVQLDARLKHLDIREPKPCFE